MGGTSSRVVVPQSFRGPVMNHIQGLHDLANGFKIGDEARQAQATETLRRNVDEWQRALDGASPSLKMGTFLKQSLADSTHDEIRLCFAIMHCKCQKGKYGQCPNGELMRSAFQEVVENQGKVARFLSTLFGGTEEEWRQCLAEQLHHMDTYCAKLAAGDPHVEAARQACLESGERMVQALDAVTSSSSSSV